MNLTRQFSTHRPLLTFVLLVFLCLTSLATGFETTFIHRGIERLVTLTAYPFLEARATIEGGADYLSGVFFAYGTLRQENTAMRQELVALNDRLSERYEMYRENQRLRGEIGFARERARIELIPAKVIENLKGMLTIDRGHRHGIEPFMAVVTAAGVVGVITKVDDFSSRVATLHHPDCRVGVMVQRNRLRAYDGVIHGERGRSLIYMWYIDMKNEVRIGDRIITSPESIFPSGYLVGEITAVHDTDSLLKYSEVRPTVDPFRLDEVFVVQRAAPPVEDYIGPPVEPLAARLNGLPESPDERPIQEQLAP